MTRGPEAMAQFQNGPFRDGCGEENKALLSKRRFTAIIGNCLTSEYIARYLRVGTKRSGADDTARWIVGLVFRGDDLP
jgi:hypothetical protein